MVASAGEAQQGATLSSSDLAFCHGSRVARARAISDDDELLLANQGGCALPSQIRLMVHSNQGERAHVHLPVNG